MTGAAVAVLYARILLVRLRVHIFEVALNLAYIAGMATFLAGVASPAVEDTYPRWFQLWWSLWLLTGAVMAIVGVGAARPLLRAAGLPMVAAANVSYAVSVLDYSGRVSLVADLTLAVAGACIYRTGEIFKRGSRH